MPAVHRRGGGRRTISEINMVPFIDVMLVLLIIFMVTAPLITTGTVDLPSIGKAARQPPKFVQVQIGPDESIVLKVDGKGGEPVTLRELGARVAALQGGDSQVAAVIAADKGVKYDVVVNAMNALQRANVEKVGLLVRSSATATSR